jgi:hypothetical protein
MIPGLLLFSIISTGMSGDCSITSSAPLLSSYPRRGLVRKPYKRHDIPRTPYQRIMASPHVPEPIKQSLAKDLEILNPFVLRTTMEAKLKKIFSVLHFG